MPSVLLGKKKKKEAKIPFQLSYCPQASKSKPKRKDTDGLSSSIVDPHVNLLQHAWANTRENGSRIRSITVHSYNNKIMGVDLGRNFHKDLVAGQSQAVLFLKLCAIYRGCLSFLPPPPNSQGIR